MWKICNKVVIKRRRGDYLMKFEICLFAFQAFCIILYKELFMLRGNDRYTSHKQPMSARAVFHFGSVDQSARPFVRSVCVS